MYLTADIQNTWKKKLKGTIDKSISTVEDFNTSILVINETSKKISKKVEMNTSIQ